MEDSGPLRNYKQVIEYFRTITTAHLAIEQFQTGMIEDIDVLTETYNPTDYPLVFLVYRNGEINEGGLVYFDFTLLVCDISRDRELLEVNRLSETHDILMDLVSKFILTSQTEVEANIELPVLTTPFVDRFNNKLSGWAAEITITVHSPLDLCSAAFE